MYLKQIPQLFQVSKSTRSKLKKFMLPKASENCRVGLAGDMHNFTNFTPAINKIKSKLVFNNIKQLNGKSNSSLTCNWK